MANVLLDFRAGSFQSVASLGILACGRRYFHFGCFFGSRRSVVGLGFAFAGASFFQLAVSWGATEWGASALDTPIFPFHDSVLFSLMLI